MSLHLLNERELELLNRLLYAHPEWGRKAISINACLRCQKVPHVFKSEYVAFYNERYPKSVPMQIP